MRPSIAPLAALALCACGGDVTTSTIQKTNGDAVTTVTGADDSGLSATVVTRNDAATSAEPWPGDAPGFAPAYPGGAVTTVAENTGNGTTGSIVTFRTADSPLAVVAFYQAQSAKAGIPRIAALSTKQSSLFSAGDPATGRALTIQAAARDGYTAAALTFSRARTAG